MMELFPGTFSQQVQSIKNSQLTKSVTTIRLRNINLISIDYGFRPRLRANSARINLAQKPLIFGDEVFTLFIVTYVSIRTSDTSRILTGIPRRLTERSATAYKTRIFINPQIRYVILAPLHLRRRNSIRPVRCTLSLKDGCFKPTSRLLRNFHILSHLITILGPYLVVWAFPSRPWTLAPTVCLLKNNV